MTKTLPYMSSPGLITKILSKIEEAKRPERFTQDFLETKLGFSGGSARPFISFLKKMGFLSSDGTPTQIYDKFRNPESRPYALADGLRNAYPDIFERNQYAENLSREKFAALVNEITGAEKESRVTQLTVSTFFSIKNIANFEVQEEAIENEKQANTQNPPINTYIQIPVPETNREFTDKKDVKFQIGYTINLNLPETTNPDVFNAIFKSLKENLLKD